MARGAKTSPEKIEEVKALAATTANIAEASRIAKIPYTTAVDISKSSDDFVELRRQAQEKYIITTWGNIEAISNALTQYITDGKLKDHNLLDFTRALKDLRQTVENVVNNIHIGNNIQNNITIDDREEFDHIQEVMKIVGDMSLEELKEKLG